MSLSVTMACPFSSIYAAKSSSSATSADSVSGQENAPHLHKSNSESQAERKISASRVAEFQHQGSFSARDDPHSKFTRGDTPTRIVWERGPSLEQLKGANGIGMVQQRVNIFSQQISMMSSPGSSNFSPFQSAGCINRSVSSSAVCSRLHEENPPPPRRMRSRQVEDKPLLKEPRHPMDEDEPLGLKNLSEAVWSFVTVPVS